MISHVSLLTALHLLKPSRRCAFPRITSKTRAHRIDGRRKWLKKLQFFTIITHNAATNSSSNCTSRLWPGAEARAVEHGTQHAATARGGASISTSLTGGEASGYAHPEAETETEARPDCTGMRRCTSDRQTCLTAISRAPLIMDAMYILYGCGGSSSSTSTVVVSHKCLSNSWQ